MERHHPKGEIYNIKIKLIAFIIKKIVGNSKGALVHVSEVFKFIQLQFRWINLVDHSFEIVIVNIKKIVSISKGLVKFSIT